MNAPDLHALLIMNGMEPHIPDAHPHDNVQNIISQRMLYPVNYRIIHTTYEASFVIPTVDLIETLLEYLPMFVVWCFLDCCYSIPGFQDSKILYHDMYTFPNWS